MLRPHRGPQDHMLQNATIIVGYGMYLVPISIKSFWCNTFILAVALENTGKPSDFLIYPHVWTPWVSPRPFVTECHHNS